MLQKEVAMQIGVVDECIWSWENNRSIPHIQHIPKIIEFLGYIPFDCPDSIDTLEKLKWFKKIRGLSFDRLGALMGRDPEQLQQWFKGDHKPSTKNLRKISAWLAELT
jgi:transcriptional regulator with XRE-family HTH domain